MSTLKQTPISCIGHSRPVVDLDFSGITSYGYYLLTASKDGLPMLREGDTGDWVGTFSGHKGAVFGASMSRDATLAATGGADWKTIIWDAEKGTNKHEFENQGSTVKTVALSHDNHKIASGCVQKTVCIYDLEKPDSEPVTLDDFQGAISSIKWHPSGKYFLTASEDDCVRLWDAHEHKVLQKLKLDSKPCSIEVINNGDRVVITHSKNVSFYNLESLELDKEFTLPTQINSASYLAEKKIFVCGGADFIMYKYDYSTGEELEATKGHFGPVHCVQFSPDGEIFASGSEDGTLRLFQTTVGKTYGLWKFESGPAGDSEGITGEPTSNSV